MSDGAIQPALISCERARPTLLSSSRKKPSEMSNFSSDELVAPIAGAASSKARGGIRREFVLSVTHWTSRLFSFTTTRNPGFRFRSGQFTMIGLEVDGRSIMRAYSIASAVYDDKLEFFSIKIPDGPLTSNLQRLEPGMQVLVSPKPTGTLVTDSLLEGHRLFLLGTGTGIAPFASIVRDPETYDRYEEVVLAHGCREVAETKYSASVAAQLLEDAFLGADARQRLTYYPTATREPFRHNGRITDLLRSGKLTSDLGHPPLDPDCDRVMVCGSQSFNADMIALLHERAFAEGSSGKPAHFVIEKAFVDQPNNHLPRNRSND
jgi:ferredoxin--NADP+ reductase